MTYLKKDVIVNLALIVMIVMSALTGFSQKLNQPKKPNILLIQTDDMGYDDLGFHGRKDLETPNLDKLAAQSIRFTDFTVSSVCAPTRAMLLTGRHFLKTGVAGVHGGHDFINLNETLMPEIFKNAGYATGIFGKWHSGKTDGYFPWDRGFDQAYMAKLYQYYPATGVFNDKPVTEKRWAQDVVTDYAINFIKQNKDKQFLAYVPYMTPHGLWRAPEDRVKKYTDKGLSVGYATLCGMLDLLDENIGRLLTELEKQGLADNTIVVFLSDNGPQPSDKKYGALTDEEWAQRNPSGYPGWKATNWSNGVKSPLFFRWPNHYKPTDVSRLVDVTDLLPTLLDIVGIQNYKTNKPLDGRSFKPFLNNNLTGLSEKTVHLSKWFAQVGDSKGESYNPISNDVREQIKFEDQSLAIRDEHFKLLMNDSPKPRPQLKGKYLLFDLKNDPLETTNVATMYPDKVKSMSVDLEKWYNGIVNNEESFQAPHFQIGWKGKESTEVPAYGPSRISGNLQNGDHYLANWKAVGDQAEYQLNVLKPGKYAVDITTGNAVPPGVKLRLKFKDNSLERELTSSKSQRVGDLFLKAGKDIFSIEVIENKNNATIDKLMEINFTLVN
jgi:arylsulfatase A-like enzyme